MVIVIARGDQGPKLWQILGHNVPSLNFLREGLNYGMLVDKLICLPIYKPRSTLTNIANMLGQPDWDLPQTLGLQKC